MTGYGVNEERLDRLVQAMAGRAAGPRALNDEALS